jgi:anti-sigma-K factor RskA
MDLVTAVICCNCAIASVIFAVAFWTVRFRRQMIGLTNFCDRCLDNWTLISNSAPKSLGKISASRNQLRQISQIYQQQLITIDRVRNLQVAIKVMRSIFR